jgi:hypothetical protein
MLRPISKLNHVTKGKNNAYTDVKLRLAEILNKIYGNNKTVKTNIGNLTFIKEYEISLKFCFYSFIISIYFIQDFG